DRLLALEPARRHLAARPGPPRQDPLAGGTRLPGTEVRPRSGPFRRTQLHRLAPSRDHCRAGPGVLPRAAAGPKSPRSALTLYVVLKALQPLLALWTGICRACRQPLLQNQQQARAPT